MATKYRDTSLLPDEDPNLTREILNVVGEEWLHAKSILLGGHSPKELIGTPDEFQVRIALRLIESAEFS